MLTEFDLALRGGLCGLLLLMAGLMLRDHPRATAARLGALFALGAAAYVVCSTPGFHARAGLWAAPALGLAAANNLVFWLFARALFDDGFRPRGWHAGLWLFIAGCGVVDGLGLDAAYPMWREPIRAFLALEALGFALLAGAQTLSSWRADLVEPRRRLRVFIVAAAGAHIAISAIANLVAGGWWGAPVRAGEAAALAVVAGAVAWSLLSAGGRGDLFAEAGHRLGGTPAPPQPLDAADRRLAAALEHAIAVDRIHRQDGLTIGALAHTLGVPEHRLRRLINRTLGQRNFNSFLNGYRIAEAKDALADPEQAPVPVLTIALDAGFNSLGPFNRAFKAGTGVTPTAYRRAALERCAPVSVPAGRISNSA